MVGSWVITNSDVLKVLEIEYDIEDKAVVQFNNDKPKRLKIYYDERPHIKLNGQKYYFDECLRA